ncbi:hypothetical protein BGX21_010694 [Mortierella sp. AD011]|nr:hypothetical protein BGX21_010694 [Mortierella sp. AD011]
MEFPSGALLRKGSPASQVLSRTVLWQNPILKPLIQNLYTLTSGVPSLEVIQRSLEPGRMINALLCKVGIDGLSWNQREEAGIRVAIEMPASTFKKKELQSIRFRHYPKNVLPKRLLSTISRTDSFLTEIRNVIQSPHIQEYLGDKSDRIKILGLDLGQACTVAASILLPKMRWPLNNRLST